MRGDRGRTNVVPFLKVVEANIPRSHRAPKSVILPESRAAKGRKMRCSRPRREEALRSDAPFGRKAIGGVRLLTKCVTLPVWKIKIRESAKRTCNFFVTML